MAATKPAVRVSFALLLAASASPAIEVDTGTADFTFQAEPLVQMRAEMDFDGPAGAAAPSGHANIDFFIRRARLLVRGTAYRQFGYTLNIVAVRVGERGNLNNAAPFLQDLIFRYMPAEDWNLETGLLLMPLSHAAVEAAGFQSSLEGPGAILLYNDARQLRETGVQLRALAFGRRLLIRGGLYEGARTSTAATGPALNPNGVPLFGGMVRWNLLGSETAYAVSGIYLDETTRVSVGVGGQFQPRSGGLRTGSSAYDHYLALATDLFADVALPGATEAVLTVGGYRFDYGPGNARTGYGVHAEAGYRWGPLEPQGTFYWFNSDTKRNSFLKIAAGLNLFVHGHHAKFQAEFASIVTNASLETTPALHQLILQAQLAL